ncbi:MAG TPA: hypothetical protein VF791_01490 [Pyrinomonadaceae bacterium]
MLRKSFQLLLLVAITATVASAQIDRARDAPFADLIRYFNDTVKYAEQKDRDSALQASNDMRKALGAIFAFSQDAPGRLNDGNLRDLGSQAQAFVDATKDLSGRLESLQDKLKRTGEDYSSELSNLKSSYETFKDKFNVIWGNLQLAGRALKAACMSGCFQ